MLIKNNGKFFRPVLHALIGILIRTESEMEIPLHLLSDINQSIRNLGISNCEQEQPCNNRLIS